MSIWGHRDSEPPAGETPETESAARAEQTEAPAEPEQQAEPAPAEPGQQGEPAPALWRAQGEAAAPAGRASAQAPPPAHGYVPAAPASPAAADGSFPQRWSEILATFVDDPRGSVTMAADTVDAAIDEFVTAVRARQQALASSWHGTEADTEQLRVALRDYRRFWHQVRQLDLSGRTG